MIIYLITKKLTKEDKFELLDHELTLEVGDYFLVQEKDSSIPYKVTNIEKILKKEGENANAIINIYAQ